MIRRLLGAAVTATALAGAIGVVRQVAEARAVARGDLERVTAATELPVAVRYGPLATRLASWVPTRPATPLGRVAASAWAAPLTFVGFVLSTLAGTRPRWDDELGCWVSRGSRGPSRVAPTARSATANTVGQVVLAIQDDPSDTLLAHEAVHVRQGERFGVGLFPLYVWLAARYGYRDHPLERAARLGAARRVSGATAARDRDGSRRP